jgi:hypothetical protein
MGWFEWAERSEAEIEAEIADELEFHLEQRTRELVEAGLGVAEARSEAERRFGSVERVRKDCRWVQLGERIMLQRIQVGLNVVLVVAVGALGMSYWQSNRVMRDQLQKLSALLEPRAAELAHQPIQEPPPPDPRVERFKTLKDPSEATAFATELAAEDPGNGRYYMEEGWRLVQDPKLRAALLAPFVGRGGHAWAIRILHLGATDRDADVREQAFQYLKSYAWQDFSGKPASIYHEWYGELGQRQLEDALSQSAQRYAKRLRAASGPALLRELGLIDAVDLEPAQIRGCDVLREIWWSGGEENVAARVRNWLASDDPALQLAAMRFGAHFPNEANSIVDVAFNVLAPRPWRSAPHVCAACGLMAACAEFPMESNSELTLRLLRLCVENPSPEVQRDVGALLARAWQLPAAPAHWLAWWKENRQLFSADKLLESEDARWLDAR